MVRRARRLRLLASTAILLAALLPHNSLANDDCGPAPSAVCDAGDAGYPTFANGIIYDPVADLTLVVDSGAEIIPNSGIEGIFIHSAGGNIDLTLEDGASVATTGSYGVHIAYNHNDVSMTLSPGGSITTNGKFARGIEIFDTTGNVKLGSYGTIVTSGTDADGIEVISSRACALPMPMPGREASRTPPAPPSISIVPRASEARSARGSALR
jgi:hypothetical protein